MKTRLRVALLPVDSPGLSSFHAYDAESFSLITAINDALVHINEDGELQPALAIHWERISPLEMEFELRQGVRFHNGEPFDAESVVATFEAHQRPTPSMVGGAVLSVITQAVEVDTYRVRIATRMPDAMLLRRLFWAQIYPKGVLERGGRDAFAREPIGTGAYRLASYQPGHEIVWYFIDGLPTRAGSATGADGLGGFVNVPPGLTHVDLKAANGVSIRGPQSFVVRPNWVSSAYVRPRNGRRSPSSD
jgi:hypothetical protein